MPSEQQIQSLQSIVPAAINTERSTGVPAELTVAQWILESGWGENSPGNNCFGIKSYPGQFGGQLLTTKEWFSSDQRRAFLAGTPGRTATLHTPAAYKPTKPVSYLYDCQDWFATFPSIEACFTAHAALFATGRYAVAIKNLQEFQGSPQWRIALIHAIAPIYATAPDYAQELLTLIAEPAVRDALATARAAPPT